MASIQQSFNQMLGAAQFASGIYAHTPAGKAAFEKRTGNTAKSAEKQAIAENKPEVAKAASERNVKALGTAAAIDPTYENLLASQTATQYHEATYNPKKEEKEDSKDSASLREVIGVKGTTKEGRAIRSLFDRSKTLVDQKEEFMNRVTALKGIEYTMEDNYYGI